MASSWGTSWGTSWGNSWGSLVDTHDGAGPAREYHPRKPRKTPRGRIAEQLRAAYKAALGIDDPEAEPLTAAQIDAVAEVVAPFAPTSAPDIPSPSVVDFEAMAAEGVQAVRQAQNVLNLVAAGRRAQAVAAAQRLDDEEAAALLLLM